MCRYSTGKQSGPASSSRRVVPASAPLPHPSSASNAANGSSSCPSPFVSGAASAQGLTRHGVPLYAHSVPVYQCTLAASSSLACHAVALSAQPPRLHMVHRWVYPHTLAASSSLAGSLVLVIAQPDVLPIV